MIYNKEIIMPLSKNDYEFNNRGRPDINGNLSYKREKLEPGTKFTFNLFSEDDHMGFTPVHIEVLGIDNGADYGLVLKAYKSNTSVNVR
ncbi:hypothetical protein KAZ57_03620 [Patescibacteria group bacterium]|nr:hypothetical protein [Patescibacteria group bacterium]